MIFTCLLGFPGGSVVMIPSASEGDLSDVGSIPGLGGSLGVGNGNPLQYSCVENFKGREAWQAIVHGAPDTNEQLSSCTYYA